MENKMTLKITKDEIFFNCEGYSEEFINSISDAISNARGRFSENQGYADIDRRVPKKEIEAKKEIGTSKRNSKRIVKIYAPGEKEEMLKAIKNGASLEEIQEKYGISIVTYYRRRAECGAVNPADNTEKVKTKSPLSALKTDNLIRDVKAGMKFKEAAEKYGINGITYARCVRLSKSDVSSSESKPENPAKAKNSSAAVIENKKVNINNIQEKIHKKPLGPLAVNPEVRQWQKDMIARGL